MAYSNYRSDWNRDRNERARSGMSRDDDDDARRARESMERDPYGNEARGGYGGRGEEQGQRYSQDYNRGYGQSDRGYGQSDSSQDYAQDYGRSRRHYGNESGGWEGREREQWRNRH